MTGTSHKLFRDPETGVLLLQLTEVRGTRRTKTYYRVEKNPNSSKAFRLCKLVHSDEEPMLYDVKVSGRDAGCDCMGYSQHGHCKHFDHVKALVEDGEL